MKILILGSEGLLGTCLQKACRKEGCEVFGRDIEDLDLCRPDEVEKALRSTAPDRVINCAALTDVDGCESRATEAYEINARAAGELARACRSRNLPLIHLSTDFVFDGTKRAPYREEDQPAPGSVYGASKWEGEQAVRRFHPEALIVRTAWLFGPAGRGDFVRAILKRARHDGELRVVCDERGSPTYAPDLAQALFELTKRSDRGLLHVVNAGETSRYDMALQIVRFAGLSVTVHPSSSRELGLPAARPAYSVLSTERLQALGTSLRPWQEALQEFIAKLQAAGTV